MDRLIVSEIDLRMMARCIELSKTASAHSEFPFASLVCRGETVVSEAINSVYRETDVTRHAELTAVSEAQKVLGRNDLSDCTLYATVEPCAMCSFPIRETRISKVVHAIRSPVMGGFSKFGILQDAEMSSVVPEIFGEPPEIVAGVLVREAEKVWRNCNPLVWAFIRYRDCIGGDPAEDAGIHWHGAARSSRFNWRQIAHMMFSKAPRKRVSPAEAPVIESAAVESPVIESPVIESPAIEGPAIESPAVEDRPALEDKRVPVANFGPDGEAD